MDGSCLARPCDCDNLTVRETSTPPPAGSCVVASWLFSCVCAGVLQRGGRPVAPTQETQLPRHQGCAVLVFATACCACLPACIQSMYVAALAGRSSLQAGWLVCVVLCLAARPLRYQHPVCWCVHTCVWFSATHVPCVVLYYALPCTLLRAELTWQQPQCSVVCACVFWGGTMHGLTVNHGAYCRQLHSKKRYDMTCEGQCQGCPWGCSVLHLW